MATGVFVLMSDPYLLCYFHHKMYFLLGDSEMAVPKILLKKISNLKMKIDAVQRLFMCSSQWLGRTGPRLWTPDLPPQPAPLAKAFSCQITGASLVPNFPFCLVACNHCCISVLRGAKQLQQPRWLHSTPLLRCIKVLERTEKNPPAELLMVSCSPSVFTFLHQHVFCQK